MQKINYKQSRKELEEIIAQLEKPTDDLDHLVNLVERGAVLVKDLNSRLAQAELSVKKVLDDLHPAQPEIKQSSLESEIPF